MRSLWMAIDEVGGCNNCMRLVTGVIISLSETGSEQTLNSSLSTLRSHFISTYAFT